MTRITSKLLYALWLVLVAAVLPVGTASAQTETIDWANAGVANLTQVPSPTTVTGSDGTTATVSRSVQTSGAGTFTFQYGDYLSYYSGDVGGQTTSLLFNFDNAAYDPNDKITYDIVLSEGVRDLSFILSDIDNGAFADAVEVYYDTDGSGSFTNAATNTAFWIANSGVTRTSDSIVNGWRGTANSATTDTIGNLSLDFGNTIVQRIRIVYFSYSGTGDPSWQFAAMSDLTYSTPGADISLTKQLLTSNPTAGDTITYRLSLTNATTSTQSATNLVVRDNLPAGFDFTSSSGTGSFDQTTGNWSISSLAIGATVTLDITGVVNATAGATLTNSAELITGPSSDPDSTPNNGSISEDDYDEVSFIVAGARVAGTAPTLVCTAGTTIFDWDSVSWTAGTTNNSYALGSLGNISFSLANPGTWLNNAAVGGQSPSRQNVVTGGLPTAEFSLLELVDLPNQSAVVTTTIDLPTAMLGAQFTLFDIDFASGQFADRIVVTGYYKGAVVMPTLTNGVVNYVIGNSAYGDGASDNTSSNGNLVVTFDGPIDQIVLQYGNHSIAPANPGQQGITIHDMTFCLPTTSMSATKVSSVFSDPVNGSSDPKAIPGAMVEYLISVSNTGELPADSGTVAVTDIVPPETKMCLADVSGGSGPILFQDSAGTSGLSYSYSGLSSTTDSLSFSSDGGSSFNYTPTADSDGCDAGITHFRVVPTGQFAEGTSFNLRARFMVE